MFGIARQQILMNHWHHFVWWVKSITKFFNIRCIGWLNGKLWCKREIFLETGINCEKSFRLKHVTEWLRWVIGPNLFLHNLLIPIRLMYVLQLSSHTPPPESCFPPLFQKAWWHFGWLVGGFPSAPKSTCFTTHQTPADEILHAQPIVEFSTSAIVGISLIFRPQTLLNRGTAVNLGLP